jgi:hypothetical protein
VLNDLRVGSARVSLRFWRRPDGSAEHEVMAREGTLVIIDAPPPSAAVPAGLREAIAALALEHAPGRLARAARLALGILE